MPRRAVFLDRDGVVNKNRPDHVKGWDEFEFETGALSALEQLAASDYAIVVISNQSGIGRGHMARATVEEIHTRMRLAVRAAGGRVDGIYYCPHAPEEGCSCRKPSPGLLEQAGDELGLDLANSWFIGDWIDDVRAARNAGATPLLVLTGRGPLALERIQDELLEPPLVFENLTGAVAHILQAEHAATRHPGGPI